MCPKSRDLKHFVFEVLVGDLRVEMEGLETLRLEVASFEKFEGKDFVEIFYPSMKIFRSHHYEYFLNGFSSKVVILP